MVLQAHLIDAHDAKLPFELIGGFDKRAKGERGVKAGSANCMRRGDHERATLISTYKDTLILLYESLFVLSA